MNPQYGGHVDVAIAGYGPVGATLAGLLGREGMSVAVFEKSGTVYAQPRAVGFDHDAMRIFQRIGAARALAPYIADFRDSRYFGADGQVIRNVERLSPPFPLHWAPNYTCDQPGVEAVLRATIARMDRVRVNLGTTIAAVSQDAEQVRFEVADARGRARRYSASYLVGCDGASSTVRRLMGGELESMAYDEPWIVVDLHVDPAFLGELPQTNVQYCEPQRPCTYIVCPGNHRRWEFMVLDGEQREGELTHERLWQLLRRWIGPEHARIWRAAAYRFHALVARSWQSGRLFLAGDSAHQTPPFLGQGMCQGLRDAGNLAWKLALAVRGQAGDGLLATYTAERRPHVVETTRLAKEIGQMLSERDAVRARERDARMLVEGGGVARTLIRQDMIPGLAGGLVALDAPMAGVALPQPVVARAGSDATSLLDDLLAPCFHFVFDRHGDAAALQALADEAGMPLVQVLPSAAASSDGAALAVTERDGLLQGWFDAHGIHGALVRPDRYVYGGFAGLSGARDLLRQLGRAGALRQRATA